jgi:hypothetical protein
MIQKHHVAPLLLSACPSFSDRWERYKQAPEYEEGLLYLDLGQFARHLVSLYQGGAIAEFSEVFQTSERLYSEGDDYVREAVRVGLLEGIRNIAGDHGIDPEVFWPYLEAESSVWWILSNL